MSSFVLQMEVTIVEPSGGSHPCPPKDAGSPVEFKYTLRAPSHDNALLEAGIACTATLKTGALAPELDALLDRLGANGKARCKVMHASAKRIDQMPSILCWMPESMALKNATFSTAL